MHLTKSGHKHHHTKKFLQSAVNTVEEGLKIYGTLKGVYDVVKGWVAAARTVATAAAPYMEYAALMAL